MSPQPTCILHALVAWLLGPVKQVAYEAFELCACDGVVHVLGASGVGGDEGQVDVGGGGAGQFALGL